MVAGNVLETPRKRRQQKKNNRSKDCFAEFVFPTPYSMNSLFGEFFRIFGQILGQILGQIWG